MNHDSPHILDLSKALHYSIHEAVVFWSEKDTCSAQPLVDHIYIQAWAQKVSSEKGLALWSPGKVMEKTVD